MSCQGSIDVQELWTFRAYKSLWEHPTQLPSVRIPNRDTSHNDRLESLGVQFPITPLSDSDRLPGCACACRGGGREV